MLGIAVLLAACGDGSRSVAAYCSCFYRQGAQLRQEYLSAGSNVQAHPLQSLVFAMASPAELADFFRGLSARAPSEIADDVQTVASAFQGSPGIDVVGVRPGLWGLSRTFRV